MPSPPSQDTLQSWYEKAARLHESGALTQAEKWYTKVLKFAPEAGEVIGLLGVLKAQQGKKPAARKLLEKACRLEPDSAMLQYNFGKLLQEAGQYREAAQCYRHCLSLAPDALEAASNLGAVLLLLGRYEQAEDVLLKATRMAPNSPDAYEAFYNLGTVYIVLRKYALAAEALETALASRPNDINGRSSLMMTRLRLCDWQGFEDFKEELVRSLHAPPGEVGAEVSAPLPYAAVLTCEQPQDILTATRLSSNLVKARVERPLKRSPRRKNGKIRIGYVSADYRAHATSYLISELIELHDRDAFEVHGFSYGANDDSAMRHRMVSAFDRFHDMIENSPQEIAGAMRDCEIDIAVDLQGFNQYNRMDIFPHRGAHIQVNYLGWPATSGADFYDYIFADRIVAPERHLASFSENVVWLPHCYQPNDRKRVISDEGPDRATCGLPEKAFVFCCFNNTFKILPETFSAWMAILKGVPEGVLWLINIADETSENLRNEARSRGIDPDRIVFSSPLPNDQHLARHAHADLFLDTWPYNAHTTSSDALWMGVPVLTRTGETFAARVATSLLNNVGLPELAVSGVEAYVSAAIRLARDPAELGRIKTSLAANRETAPLFDTTLRVQGIERAYKEMIARYDRGDSPTFFDVETLGPAE